MKRWTLAMIVTMTAAVAAAAPKAPVMTQIWVLVGRPVQESGPSVELANGTVIALAGRERPRGLTGRSARTLERIELARKLEDTFRIRLDTKLGASDVAELKPGMTRRLEAAAGAVGIDVRLTGMAGDAASYEVAFRKGNRVLSTTPLTVAVGGRAVVGARDGEAAPFVFVLVAPVRPGEGTPLLFAKGTDVVEPRLVHSVQPVYPESARKEKIGGVVVLETVIDRKGAVTSVTPLKSPDERLTAAAVNAVRQWRFEPARDKGGRPVAVVYALAVRFVLQ